MGQSASGGHRGNITTHSGIIHNISRVKRVIFKFKR